MIIKLIPSAIIGGFLGYLYYKKIGCASGTCPITANPYISTIYGAIMGIMIGGTI